MPQCLSVLNTMTMIFREAKRYGINGYKCIEVAKPAEFEIQKAATCSHLRPLAATRVAASGRKWPLGQVAASGRKWPVALLVGFEISRAASLAAICIICNHLQPRCKWLQVAASGCKWLHMMQVMLLGRQIPARMAPPVKT